MKFFEFIGLGFSLLIALCLVLQALGTVEFKTVNHCPHCGKRLAPDD